MQPGDSEFLSRLQRGPAFLLLGQSYLRLGGGEDPFLSEAARKYGTSGEPATGYDLILDNKAVASKDAALAWMDELCKRLTVPEWLSVLGGYAWSGVYSSAIDSMWFRSFRNDWRDVALLFEEKHRPLDPRNRNTLHCTALFGSVNRTEEGERPPLTRFELVRHRQVAVALTRRLPELITPFGTLAIEGYFPSSDWLALDELLVVLDGLSPKQAHLFSASPSLPAARYVGDLVRRGTLVLHEASLAATLSAGASAGVLKLGRRPSEEEAERRITVDGTVLVVPRGIWNHASRSALILDDTLLAPAPSLSDDARYREFRAFLSDSEGRPNWTAFARGFAFPRQFEAALFDSVNDALGSRRLIDEPIVLHGQTGTGKTVALGALAHRVRREARYPVLFIERRVQRPVQSDIDRFCQWAEDSGARACLLVWDGMVDTDDYAALLKYLTSRGRKVVLVGSAYRMVDTPTGGRRLMEAPAQLNEGEIKKFREFLRSFHPSLSEVVERVPYDETFLVALYRLLPPTRAQLRAGVTREVVSAERAIARKAKETAPQFAPQTALARALLEAGLLKEESLLSTETKEVGGELVDEIQDLTGLVMVPGRFGLAVPLELLVRALGKTGYSNFVDLVRRVDVFRWFEDSTGNIDLGPRNALEAKLLVQARMGGATTEVAFVRRLLLEVQPVEFGLREGREVRFAVDLLRAVGAQGSDNRYFAPHFKELSSTLTELRRARGIENPRIMLQEANLLREWAIAQAKRGVASPEVRAALEEVEGVLRRAVQQVGGERRSRSLESALVVELGAALASKARYAADYAHDRAETTRLFNDARQALLEARAYDPANYYAVDVLAWATRDALQRDMLEGDAKFDAIADVLYAFQSADPDEFTPNQLERFHARRMEFADLIGEDAIAEDAFNELVAHGSAAGVYLRALRASGLANVREHPAAIDLDRLSRGLRYLNDYRDLISGDVRCLGLLLELWWIANTGARFFEKERATVPLRQEQWTELLKILEAIHATGQWHRTAFLGFFRALSLFHLGDVDQAIDVLREVERESDQVRGRRRVIRSYLASTPQGRPQVYHGAVAWVSPEGRRGDVYVEEFRRKIPFLPLDFGPDVGPKDSLDDFHIAFNFLGLLADPIRPGR